MHKSITWEEAIWNESRYKSYPRGDKYVAIVHSHARKRTSLGSYTDRQEADDAIYECMKTNLINTVSEYGLNIDDCAVVKDRYIVFRNGMIFSLTGRPVVGSINSEGYNIVSLYYCPTTRARVVASAFCKKKTCDHFVRHIDGNKLNDDASNLKWVPKTRSKGERK